MQFVKTTAISFELTPSDLAEAWCGMNSDEQAEFFNTVARLGKDWGGILPAQLQYLSENPLLNSDGRSAMRMIGDYSYKPTLNPPTL